MVRAIAADLDDPTPRTAYLDWLLEREDPRGELMRAQRAREPLDDAEDFDKAERDPLDGQIAAARALAAAAGALIALSPFTSRSRSSKKLLSGPCLARPSARS